MEELEGLGKGGSALLHTVEQHVSELRHAERAWSRVAALRGEELCQRWWARTADAVTEACKQRGQSEQHDVASALAAGQEQARREVDSAAPFRLSLRLLPPDAPAVPREHALRSGPGMRGEERLLLKEDSQNFLQGGGLPALAAHSAAPAPSVASAADPAPPLAARGARLAGLVASTLIRCDASHCPQAHSAAHKRTHPHSCIHAVTRCLWCGWGEPTSFDWWCCRRPAH